MCLRRYLASAIVGIAAPLLIALATSVAAQEAVDINQADTILYNGKIVTVDADFRIAQAVAIRDGKFIAVGTDRDVRALAGSKTASIDLKGGTVLPGLIDSHAHLEAGGVAEYTISLERTRSVAEVLATIKETAAKAPPGQWILGGRWDPHSQLAERHGTQGKEPNINAKVTDKSGL